jgi:hypothetical protein
MERQTHLEVVGPDGAVELGDRKSDCNVGGESVRGRGKKERERKDGDLRTALQRSQKQMKRVRKVLF